MTDSQQFRADGHAAIDWAADYLEGMRELPVMSTVAPGDIRAQLPSSPPEQAEPFADVLADLDRVLLPGITHWNHPRFFAYFAITGSEPGILAELLADLTPAQARIARLMLLEDLRQADVADALNVSRATVSVAHARGHIRSIDRLLDALRGIMGAARLALEEADTAVSVSAPTPAAAEGAR